MSRTSNVVWSVIGVVVAILLALGLVYGPDLYTRGKALVGPLVDIAQSEERLTDLNIQMPFVEPADGTVDGGRFSVFLDIRRDLLPRYLEWQAIERELEHNGQEDWEDAMEVLAAVRGVMTMQIETLQKHGMSPAEFIWIEDLAYVTWVDRVKEAIQAGAVTEALRKTTAADKEALAALEGRFGSSRTTREFAALLDQRLQSLDNPSSPPVEGMSEATSSLFWEHRGDLSELDLASFSALHKILRGKNNVDIKIDNEEE